MANWSQSHFLQAIGWAILNSLWQMALLWCIYLAVCHIFNFSSGRKYKWAAASLFTGFAWFLLNFVHYSFNSTISDTSIFSQGIYSSKNVLQQFLIAASVAYLVLLIFPAWKLFRNWKFVLRIQKSGLHKADLHYRLFVQNISMNLGIGKKVALFVSDLITSPVTVGYLKPIILLPVAALNNLSVQQVEAILLHELAHIRRFDYLVNLFINIISTLLYFNPFVRLFSKAIEEERENCCDELVLQFEYDTATYASALFTLEKLSSQVQVLALAATGKNSLLKRIEKMAGMEKKNNFSFRQLAGLLTALLCIIAFNSIIIIKDQQKKDGLIYYSSMTNPFLFAPEEIQVETPVKQNLQPTIFPSHYLASQNSSEKIVTGSNISDVDLGENQQEIPSYFVHAGTDDIEASLSIEQKEQVSSTVKATKKIMKSLQWKEIENEIAEVMTPVEKAVAKQEHAREIDNLNWENIERNLKAQYEKLDWQMINDNLSTAMTKIELDNIYSQYVSILNQLERTEKEINKASVSENPVPDASVSELKRVKEVVKDRINTIQSYRTKKIIRL